MTFHEFTNVHEFFFDTIDSAILVVILAVILCSYLRSRRDPKISQRALTYLALAFGLEVIYHILQIIYTGIAFEISEPFYAWIVEHALEVLCFSVLGLAVLRARVVNKKPLQALFTVNIVALAIFTAFVYRDYGAIYVSTTFGEYWGHVVFELWHLAILVFVIALLFDIWKRTKKRTKAEHLLILWVAFSLWAVGHIVHIYNLITTGMTGATIRWPHHLFETVSFLLLGAYVYTSAQPRPKTLPDRYKMAIEDIIAHLLKMGVAPAIVLASKAAAEVHKKHPKRFTILIDDKGELSGHADIETLDVFVEKLANMLGPRLKPLTKRVAREICEKHRIIEAEETYADKLANLFTLA
ncbi:MAG: hypothetical protein QMC78_06250 [Methanocellales archaeon]|nr:hypothetical protein [Methanocellales archaeon]